MLITSSPKKFHHYVGKVLEIVSKEHEIEFTFLSRTDKYIVYPNVNDEPAYSPSRKNALTLNCMMMVSGVLDSFWTNVKTYPAPL